VNAINNAVLFLESTALRYPGNVAVETETECMTYRQLRDTARSVATALLSHCPRATGTVSPVLVLLPKSAAAVTAFMGVLYSGNCYVPVDYSIPKPRLQAILDNLRPPLIITDAEGQYRFVDMALGNSRILLFDELADARPNHAAVDEAVRKVSDCEPIYIMYTSGSTGVPKGVVIPHRGVIDYAGWVVNTFGITAETVLGNQAALFFDNSVLDIYGAFATGAKLVLIPEVLFQFPVKIPDYINEKGITCIFFVPTVLIHIANSGVLADKPMPKLTKVLFCGEVMPTKQYNIWRRYHPGALYANLYGPTEITDVCAYYIIDRAFSDDDALPIGIPCENMNVMILTDGGAMAQTGETGELCVSGSGVALGYWGAGELTRKAFTQNPANPHYSEIIYRTGDLAYRHNDGLLRFVGRKDSQIKFKGNRIELGDIESAVKNLSGVENAAVLFDADKEEIIAFMQSGEALTLRGVNKLLLELLPKYMMLSKLFVLPRLPLTPNGKIDRVKLKHDYT
jgi:amino acid adenylation domain-containing protein